MLKKYSSFAASNPLTPVVEEHCPPGLWKTQAVSAAIPGQTATATAAHATEIALTNAEHTQLHVRVIALENLVIALLASATEHQLDCAREMAAYISPRVGATTHPLTTHAASEMMSIVDRAVHFRGTPPK